MHANYGFVTYKLILTYSKTVSEETSTTSMVKASWELELAEVKPSC